MNMNIKDLHARFCQEAKLIKNYSDRTIQWYECSLRLFLTWCRINKREVEGVDEVTTTLLRDYLYSKRLEGKWSAHTFVTQYNGLSSFLNWCVKLGHMELNPIKEIEKPKLPKQLPKRISKQEALRLLECAFNMKTCYRFERYRNRAIFAVMIFAGLRAAEVLSLKVGDVDMMNNVINVQSGKGNKDRIVPMSSTLFKYLKEYLAIVRLRLQ